MTASRRGIATALLAVVLVATTACSMTPAAGSAAMELIVFGAASLKAPLERIAATYEAGHPGLTISLAVDSSATLRTQIEQGAPADVFLSADIVNPERLVASGLAAGPVTRFAGNAVVLAVPSDNVAVEAWFDLPRDGVAIIAAGANVPITAYTDRLVAALAATPGAPTGFVAGYERNVVSREDNARAIVAKLELGEGDAAFIYRTDAIGSSALRTIALPDGVGVAVSYGGVTIGRSERAAAAAAFLDWLTGPEGQGIFAEFKFTTVA